MSDSELNSLGVLLEAIESGHFDEHIGEIQSGLNERKEILKSEVLTRVKEIFGDDAEVILGADRKKLIEDTVAEREEQAKNLFVRKAERDDAPQEPPQPPDPLAGLDSLEEQMASEAPPSVGRGGAIIGGMRPSDMN